MSEEPQCRTYDNNPGAFELLQKTCGGMVTLPSVLDAYMFNAVRGPPVTTTKYAELALTRS